MAPHPPEKTNNGIYGPIVCCACKKIIIKEGLRFPKNPLLRSKWVQMIMDRTPDYPGKRETMDRAGLQLCVEHFERKMLIQKIEDGRKINALKKGGYPTNFQNMNNGTASHYTNADSTMRIDDEEISICFESTATNDAKPRLSMIDDSKIMHIESSPSGISTTPHADADPKVIQEETTPINVKAQLSPTSDADTEIMQVECINAKAQLSPTSDADTEIMQVECSPNSVKSRLSTTSDDDSEIMQVECTSNSVKSRLSTTSDADPEIIQIKDTSNIVSQVDGSAVQTNLTNNLSVSDAVKDESPISKNDEIPSIQEFISLLRLKNDKYFEPWKLLYRESSVLFSLLDEDCKYLIQSFTVHEDLKVSCFYHGQPFTDKRLSEILGDNFKLDTWTKFKKLILFLHTLTKEKTEISMKLKGACQMIHECIQSGEKFGLQQKEIKKLKFSVSQIESCNGEVQKYSHENLQWAFNAYNVNRQGYTKIYDSDFLTLPHPASLELFKRQFEAKRLQMRPKILVKKPFQSNFQNGHSPNGQTNVMTPLANRNDVQHVSVNNIAATNHTLTGLSGLTPNNNVGKADDDCEIQEI